MLKARNKLHSSELYPSKYSYTSHIGLYVQVTLVHFLLLKTTTFTSYIACHAMMLRVAAMLCLTVLLSTNITIMPHIGFFSDSPRPRSSSAIAVCTTYSPAASGEHVAESRENYKYLYYKANEKFFGLRYTAAV